MKTLKFLALIGLLGILGALFSGVYFFGGYYSVGGTAYEPEVVKNALVQVRTASIKRHAKDQPPANLDGRAQAGARAYNDRGCVNCHGAPGVDWQKFSEGLTPDPPDLNEVAPERTPSEIFWVIKNGINMTGMPAFAKIEVPDDEIWSIVAFVKRLPQTKPEDFKAWTAPATPPAAPTPPATAPNPP